MTPGQCLRLRMTWKTPTGETWSGILSQPNPVFLLPNGLGKKKAPIRALVLDLAFRAGFRSLPAELRTEANGQVVIDATTQGVASAGSDATLPVHGVTGFYAETDRVGAAEIQ